MYLCDDWPQMPDDSDFDGEHLLTLIRSGNSPFHGVWDVNLLLREIEDNLVTKVIDIPLLSKGSHNYGFHFQLSNQPDIVARLARSDVNMPDYDGFPVDWVISEAVFEVAVYELLRLDLSILALRLLYHRIPIQHGGTGLALPQNIAGRRLFLFQRAEGENNAWWNLGLREQASLLAQSARIRALLFDFTLPLEFANTWLRERLFEQKPASLPIPVAPTRQFCIALFTFKVEATIRNLGEMIGWESDQNVVGLIAAAAKQSLLRLIPHIMPVNTDLYRLVLEHGDFGIHNMSVAINAEGQPLITSLFDWETACIVPAMLSDPLMAVVVDLVTDENANPSVTRTTDDETPNDRAKYMMWSQQYFAALFDQARNYEYAIKAGKDARHLWFALRQWRGDDPEEYFGDLGAWAERRMKELGVIS